MSAASDDRELEESLADAAQLRQRYRAVSRDEPPDALDALIRAAALDQATSRSGQVASRLTASWRVPLSIAAVVVVSATVSVLVAERQGQLPHGTERSVNPPPATAPADEKRTEPGAPQGRLSAAPAGKSQGKVRFAPEPPQRSASQEPTVARQATSDAFSAPPEPGPSQEPSKTQEPLTQSSSQNVLRSAATQQAAPPATAGLPAAPGRLEPGADKAGSEESAQESGDRATPERPAEALRKERAPQAFAPAAAKLERDHGVAEKQSASAGPAWQSDPEAWLKHIDELRLAGQAADAEASFRAFKDRYPAYPLPAGFVAPKH